jgi:hypothetical protein
MKGKIAVTLLLGLMSTCAFAQNEEKQLGIGLILGEPTGLSVKYWLDEEHAVDGGVAWSFWDGDGFQLHSDFLWHNFDLLDDPGGVDGKLPVYLGVGARLKFRDDEGRHHDDNDTVFGIRVPLGVSYLFDGKPIDLFAEIAPILDLTPDIELNFSLALGVRFYVK